MTPEPISWWLLGLGAFFLLVTINTLRPYDWGVVPSALSFLVGFFMIEAPIHHLVIQATVVVTLLAKGALDSWPGWFGLVLSLLSGAGLVWCLVRNLGSRSHVRNELCLAGIPAADRLFGRIPKRSLLWQISRRPKSVERIGNIEYHRVSDKKLYLDLYRLKSRPEKRPVLLWFHGGGWVLGGKRQQGMPLIHHLASLGWITVSANYRFAPRTKLGEIVLDAKRALAWVREHVQEYGGDPETIVVTGGSAGCHLASLLALSPNDPDLQPGFEEIDTSVQACVAMYGVYDLVDEKGLAFRGLRRFMEKVAVGQTFEQVPELYRRLSPLHRVTEDAPPFLVVQGVLDTLAPVAGARDFVETYRRIAEQELVYVEIPHTQHAFDVIHSPRTNAVVEGIGIYLEHFRSRRQ